MRDLHNIDGFMFDLDGSIYMGDSLMPGAAEVISFLRKIGKKIVYITNNSASSAWEVAKKLSNMGLEIDKDQIILPTAFAGEYILDKYGISKVFVIGTKQMTENIRQFGHTVCNITDHDCDVVLVGRDMGFDYKKLEKGAIFIQKGAKLVAANMDKSHPVEYGMNVPETGALVASICEVVNIVPEVIGKPSRYIFEKALKAMELPAASTAIVGDNPMTDISGGKESGLYTIWIANQHQAFLNQVNADIVCNGLEQLAQLLITKF